MHAFIVRPFGVKKVQSKNKEVDFDKVEAELIQPALMKAGVVATTTAAILEAGNIRQDMFEMLLTADIVIADLSIHNANVFYELGIRHALRDKKTFMIRFSGDKYPFDLETDRYLSYDESKPEASVEALYKSIRDTILSEKSDSPVFMMLPKLKAQNPELFLAVPRDFAEEVEAAERSKFPGKLALLASEVEGFPWEIPALRMIGEAQFRLKDDMDARKTWEKIRHRYYDDIDANDRLSTIYQRLADLAKEKDPKKGTEYFIKSDQAVDRLMKNADSLSKHKQAEIFSLKGRNAKTRWVDSWKNLKTGELLVEALQSPFLRKAYELYLAGFNKDLNHFYSGINALSLLTILVNLAESKDGKKAWNAIFESDEDATYALRKYKEQRENLASIVKFSVAAARQRSDEANETDVWLNFTNADLNFLNGERVDRIKYLYKLAVKQGDEFAIHSAKRQLLIFKELNVIPDEVVNATLSEFKDHQHCEEGKWSHFMLFTGHMIDKGDRNKARFPAANEAKVKEGLLKVIEEEKKKIIKNAEDEIDQEIAKLKKQIANFPKVKAAAKNGGGEAVLDHLKHENEHLIEKLEHKKKEIECSIVGVAGGACGGDILFHEICKDLGIKTSLYLTLPPDKLVKESVEFAGEGWVERFRSLQSNISIPKQTLSEDKKLPVWLAGKAEGYSIWERSNLWMLNAALVNGGANMTLIALWDGKISDKPGGTSHMVKEAKERGAYVRVVNEGLEDITLVQIENEEEQELD